MLTLECWLDSKLLEGLNTQDDIVKKGFRFSPTVQGFKFQVGDIPTNTKGILFNAS